MRNLQIELIRYYPFSATSYVLDQTTHSSLLAEVCSVSARCFVELVCAEVQNQSAYSHSPCLQDKWQNNQPKKMKQLMDLERGLGSPGSKIAYYVLACASCWNVS